MHIYDPRYAATPSWPIPLPNAPVAAYREVQATLGLTRAVIVQPNGYKFDNACTEEAVGAFGSSARGIATVPADIPDAELERLTRVGFVGARCHIMKGGSLSGRRRHDRGTGAAFRLACADAVRRTGIAAA
jgi:D-galactarolactone isomerase